MHSSRPRQPAEKWQPAKTGIISLGTPSHISLCSTGTGSALCRVRTYAEYVLMHYWSGDKADILYKMWDEFMKFPTEMQLI